MHGHLAWARACARAVLVAVIAVAPPWATADTAVSGGAATAATTAAPVTATATTLKVCLDSDHAPFSSAAAPTLGLDVDLANVLAGRLGRALQVVWVDVPRRGGLLRALREQLDGGRCQVFFGVPTTDEPLPARWRASAPYATLRYLWVAPPGHAVPGEAGVRQARAIGVVTATPADLYLHAHALARSPYPHNAALIDALARSEVPLALLWSAAWAQATPRPAGDGQGPDDPDLRTSLTWVSAAADPPLTAELHGALAALTADGTLARLTARHGLAGAPP